MVKRYRPAPMVLTQADCDLILKYIETEEQILIPENVAKSKVLEALDYTAIFSPKSFDEYIGQSEASYLARIMVIAAKNESRPLPNILIVGEYGLGKTSLAKIIIQEYGEKLRLYDGTSINKVIPESGLIVIDEIHNLDPETADTLNLHIDTGHLTIVGCTTNSGVLPSAFRSRFRTLFLEDYTEEELAIILTNVCERRKTDCDKNAIQFLAKRSRFNARHAIMLLQTVFDFMAVKYERALTEGVVIETLTRLGIDDKGFLPRDRKYLNTLPQDRPVGLSYLSAVLGIDEQTIEQEIEPYLLRMGFIDRQPRGRIRVA